MEKSTARWRRIAAHAVYTPQGLLPNGIVSVDEQGVITDISSSSNIDALERVEFYSGILIPAMVNAHSHLELAYMEGAIEPGGGFAEFARQMAVQRDQFTLQQRLRAIELHDARMWHDGIVAVGDICNGDSTFELKTRSRIYYHNFLELFGLGVRSDQALQPLLKSARALGLTASITPHSTYSLSREGFGAGIGDGLLSIHFMESKGESELYNKGGELWNWYRRAGFEVDFLEYGSPTGRLMGQIAGDRKVLLVHGVCATESDVRKLMDHFGAEAVTWVLCPRSNSYISGLQPPVQMLRQMGVRIAVGTDSLASSWDLSMVEQMKMWPQVPLTERLEWATINGARALGIDKWCGSLEIGKRSGVVLLSGVDIRSGEFGEDAKTTRII